MKKKAPLVPVQNSPENTNTGKNEGPAALHQSSILVAESEYDNSTMRQEGTQQVSLRTYKYTCNSYGLWDHYPEWGPYHDPDMLELKKILKKEGGKITKVEMKAICYNGGKAGEKVNMEQDEKKTYIDPLKSIMRKEGVSYGGATFIVSGEVMPYVMEGDGGCSIEVKITYSVPNSTEPMPK